MTSRIWTQIEQLAQCLCAQFEKDDNPRPCFCGVIPGETAGGSWTSENEECDEGECGMAWVRLATAFPSSDMINPSLQPGNCGTEIALNIEMGVIRCIKVVDDEGNGPTSEELLSASIQQVQDLVTMKRALMCCTSLSSVDWVLGSYTPSGPLGGFVGGMWTLALMA